jgi:hypothetical protein
MMRRIGGMEVMMEHGGAEVLPLRDPALVRDDCAEI